MDPEMKKLVGYAIAVVTLAVVDVMGLAVLQGFKNTNLVNNATADLFIAGLAVFGTFIGIVVLAVIGKVVIKLFTDKDM